MGTIRDHHIDKRNINSGFGRAHELDQVGMIRARLNKYYCKYLLFSRDYAVEISTPEELTGLNSKLRGIDQASLIFASGLAGLTVSYDKAIGSAIIGGFNILAMIVQVTMLYKVTYISSVFVTYES